MSLGEVKPWLVIRQEANGNRYRVGRFATRAEAQRVAGQLGQGGGVLSPSGGLQVSEHPESPENGTMQRYLVIRIDQESGAQAS